MSKTGLWFTSVRFAFSSQPPALTIQIICQVGLDPAMVSATVQEMGISPGWTGSKMVWWMRWRCRRCWILSNPALFSGDCRGQTGAARLARNGKVREVPLQEMAKQAIGVDDELFLDSRGPGGIFWPQKPVRSSRCFPMLDVMVVGGWWVSTRGQWSWIVSLAWETLGVGEEDYVHTI